MEIKDRDGQTTEVDTKIEGNVAKSLFRQEVIQAKNSNYFGKTLIVTPVTFLVWTLGIFFIAIAIGMYLYFGEYTKRHVVEGVLVSNKGLINIQVTTPGVVKKKFVQQGEEISKGQLLYLISTEQESISQQSLSVQQVESLKKTIEIQKEKTAVSKKQAHKYLDLFKKGYISYPDNQDKQNAYLADKTTLIDYEIKLASARGGVEYAIRAPEDGTISMLVPTVGEYLSAQAVIGSIVPKEAQLEGLLYVPTSKAGFIKIGQRVRLKYKPYPYQRFGMYEAVVSGIDKSITNPQDVKMPFRMEEVFYRVYVTLQKQTINAYGNSCPLTNGMLIEGAIMGDRRNVWQWIMEPIYSIRGNL